MQGRFEGLFVSTVVRMFTAVFYSVRLFFFVIGMKEKTTFEIMSLSLINVKVCELVYVCN